MLTDEQVEEITAREAKATPGPWCGHKEAGVPFWQMTARGKHSVLPIARYMTAEDIVFCSKAKTDIPALLDDRKEMRKLLREAVAAIELSRQGMNFHANEFLANAAVQELVK